MGIVASLHIAPPVPQLHPSAVEPTHNDPVICYLLLLWSGTMVYLMLSYLWYHSCSNHQQVLCCCRCDPYASILWGWWLTDIQRAEVLMLLLLSVQVWYMWSELDSNSSDWVVTWIVCKIRKLALSKINVLPFYQCNYMYRLDLKLGQGRSWMIKLCGISDKIYWQKLAKLFRNCSCIYMDN